MPAAALAVAAELLERGRKLEEQRIAAAAVALDRATPEDTAN
jgi:hypothetical protein